MVAKINAGADEKYSFHQIAIAGGCNLLHLFPITPVMWYALTV